MGTLFKIIMYAPDQAAGNRAARAAFDRIAALDNIMSDYHASSELMRLCDKAGGAPVRVSDDLFRVLEKSQEVAARSDGAFDITVGPPVRLWRRARRQHELPDQESLAQALKLVGYRNLSLDPRARTAQLLKTGMRLDLGGIAKGDAADQALLVLDRYGIKSALVAAAGDIAVSRPPPGKDGWRIGIAPLQSSAPSPARYLLLHDAGISTSGDAEQHVEIGGVRYSHIIDPRTGVALTGRSSVTVIAPDGITADSLATAVSVLGPEHGLQLINSMPGTAALFIQQTEQGIRAFESRFPPASSTAQ
jgi:thiamine biosynthesis lipoprotein